MVVLMQCGTGDLNPQVFQHMYLKHARLPIPPVPQSVIILVKVDLVKSDVKIAQCQSCPRGNFDLNVDLR